MQSSSQTTFSYEDLPACADALLVFAHPDDEVCVFGGVLPALIAAGQDVVCVCMTSGAGGGSCQVREQELRQSLWTCGLRCEPLFADFEDCGYVAPGEFESLDWVWQRWGSREQAARYMYKQYVRFQPKIVFSHNPYTGDYGHPNHMASGWACIDGYQLCSDAGLEQLRPDALRSLIISSKSAEAKELDFSKPLAAFSNATAYEVASAALDCHQSQEASRRGLRADHRFERMSFKNQDFKCGLGDDLAVFNSP